MRSLKCNLKCYFFLSCNRYTQARNALFDSVNNFLKPGNDIRNFRQNDALQLLLYGDSKKLLNFDRKEVKNCMKTR